ncbi:hypothetical protein SISNIDRAFT_419035 [Sistotremastrum niveocremeum HHB9708]|uniref:hAT-like transposase RNase-H fold domain-containing protein n=1 Tax=Sistotremastrum niveocremeum HHB9708 TaxID=1314777 RepID=A0A164NLN3_9AGAM|nr:hypothetical protein SISNIDRAFT_419035 [Sistotremastrum niveocremeum HHB9708]
MLSRAVLLREVCVSSRLLTVLLNYCQAINRFCETADARFGVITTLRINGVKKEIPWKAFKLSDSDWVRVTELIEILKDVDQVQQVFSAAQLPTLWKAIPEFERLQTAWEKKERDAKYALYAPGIRLALDKLKKYYCDFDDKPVFVLALYLHPYYKLAYISRAWGGAKEQAAERAKGNKHAKNWLLEAETIVKSTVRH